MFHLFLFSILSSCATLNQVFSPSKDQKPKVSKIESTEIIQDFVLNGKFVIFDDDHYYMGSVLAEKLVKNGNEVIFVTPRSLPKTTSGKLSRKKAKDDFINGIIKPLDIF